ncbi:hypothetical protein GCM10010403_28440 [Glycomyces rutgersensis]|uniref:Uncharacterized protein n=1 Tax=Glycomyces rutgersensis TaxID=58115 RepID=A0ABN3FPK4_9ACTN
MVSGARFFFFAMRPSNHARPSDAPVRAAAAADREVRVTWRTARFKAAPTRAAMDGLRWDAWAAASPADFLRKRSNAISRSLSSYAFRVAGRGSGSGCSPRRCRPVRSGTVRSCIVSVSTG